MDNLTKDQRYKNMRNVRSKDTRPERLIKAELRRMRYRFAENVEGVIGKPDIVFKRRKVALFIDSDFWHGNPKRFRLPKSNKKYWRAKISRNRERDTRVTRSLRASGWRVIRIWEHDVEHNFPRVIRRIARVLSNTANTSAANAAG